MNESDAVVDTREQMQRALVTGLDGRYEGFEPVGRGGMAEVFRARDLRHQRTVAIKVLRPGIAHELSSERFQQEIQLEASLDHPGILTVLDSGRLGDLLYYVALWADDGSLRDRLDRGPALSVEESVRIVSQVAEALGVAHERGVVHRDVKPENILFRSGHALLADFGIARVTRLSTSQRLTSPGLALGSVRYMSPEQGIGDAPIDGRSDQYGLACVLFEMLTGDPPFTGRDPNAILARHLADQPPSLAVIRPDLPPGIRTAIERALAKRPADRFRTVREFAAAIETASEGARSRPAWRRQFVAAAASVALTVGAWFAMDAGDGPSAPNATVAVLPLEVSGAVPGDSTVGVGIAYLLGAALERTDPLRFVDLSAELAPSRRIAPQTLTSGEARQLARGTNSSWLLRGSVQAHGDSVTVILRLFDVAGDSLAVQASRTGASGAPLHHLAIDAVKDLMPIVTRAAGALDLSALRERSTAAVALWMQGEHHYRRAQYSEAAEFYGRALARDSTFAFAAIRAAQSLSWRHDVEGAARWAAVAVANAGQLPPRYVLLARGLLYFRRGMADSAIAWLRAADSAAVGWAEAATALGEAHVHLVPSEWGSASERARAALERAHAIDSTFAPALHHLAEFTIRDGRVGEARRLIAALERSGADESLRVQLRLMAECVETGPDFEWSRRMGVGTTVGLMAAKALATGLDQFACAEAGFDAVLRAPAASDGERWAALLGVVQIRQARGAESSARALLDSVVASGMGPVRSWYVHAFAVNDQMSDAAVELGRYARESYGEDLAHVRSAEQLWVLSLLARREGDLPRARAARARLQRWADSSRTLIDGMYLASSTAHVAALSGDTASAIAILERQGSQMGTYHLAWEMGPGLAADRLHLAQLLLASGRVREAAAAAAVLDHPDPISFVAAVPAALAVRLQAARRLGDEAAISSLRRRLEQLGRHDLLY